MFLLAFEFSHHAQAQHLSAAIGSTEVASREQSAVAASDVSAIGIIVAGGVECALAALDDGRVYALDGVAPNRFAPGTKIRILGRPTRISACMQGQVLKPIDLKVVIDPENARQPNGKHKQ